MQKHHGNRSQTEEAPRPTVLFMNSCESCSPGDRKQEHLLAGRGVSDLSGPTEMLQDQNVGWVPKLCALKWTAVQVKWEVVQAIPQWSHSKSTESSSRQLWTHSRNNVTDTIMGSSGMLPRCLRLYVGKQKWASCQALEEPRAQGDSVLVFISPLAYGKVPCAVI